MGHVRLVGGVGHWGGVLGGVLEEYHVHMHTYTHVGTRITGGNKLKVPKMQTKLNYFQ